GKEESKKFASAELRWWLHAVSWNSKILLCVLAPLRESRSRTVSRKDAKAQRFFRMKNEQFDLLIIGAGPAGLSAADAAAREGLDYLVIEKGTIANTIRQYPVGRTLFSTPNELEMREGSLKLVHDKPTREELLSHYIHFVLDHDLRIATAEEVTDITRNDDDVFMINARCR